MYRGVLGGSRKSSLLPLVRIFTCDKGEMVVRNDILWMVVSVFPPRRRRLGREL